jgi:predicted GNAT superfamily acetyltransferase
MSTTNTPASDPNAANDAGADIVDDVETEFRLLTTATDMGEVAEVFQQVWGSVTEVVPLEMLMAIAHADGYVAAAYEVRSGAPGHGRIVGASVGIRARHQDQPALHSHVTGILPGVRSSGLGRAMKLHQQDWARARDIDWIVWTYDPLVRRNAWFNIAVLGAEVHEYLPHFYGDMTDSINAGDDSDRLLMAWDVTTDPDAPLHDGTDLSNAPTSKVSTPADIVTLRRTDPAAVKLWRETTREALVAALDAGGNVIGFTRDGDYLIGGRQ